MNLLSLINPLLANVDCSITLSNHGVIMLKKFVSQFTCKLCNWFFFHLHLMFNIYVQTFNMMEKLEVWWENFESKHSLYLPLFFLAYGPASSVWTVSSSLCCMRPPLQSFAAAASQAEERGALPHPPQSLSPNHWSSRRQQQKRRPPPPKSRTTLRLLHRRRPGANAANTLAFTGSTKSREFARTPGSLVRNWGDHRLQPAINLLYPLFLLARSPLLARATPARPPGKGTVGISQLRRIVFFFWGG